MEWNLNVTRKTSTSTSGGFWSDIYLEASTELFWPIVYSQITFLPFLNLPLDQRFLLARDYQSTPGSASIVGTLAIEHSVDPNGSKCPSLCLPPNLVGFLSLGCPRNECPWPWLGNPSLRFH